MVSFRMTSLTKRNLLLTFKLAAIAGILATSISSWQNYSIFGFVRFHNVANGLVDGFLIVGVVAGYKLLIVDVLLRRIFVKFSFMQTLLLNSALYALLILFSRALGRFVMEYEKFVLFPMGDPVAKAHFYQAMVIALAFSIVFNFLLQLSRLLGPNVLANFITGRYHRPRREMRVVMFMDLKGSTTLAEKMGDTAFVQFLADAFADLTEPLITSGGEVYKYVGDELIVTWPAKNGVASPDCLLLPLASRKIFTARAGYYEREYGSVPEFRAGLHVGNLVVGEVGVLKREIALLGDTMNTAARVAGHTRESGCDILISKTLLTSLGQSAQREFRSIGAIQLKGKSAALELFSPLQE